MQGHIVRVAKQSRQRGLSSGIPRTQDLAKGAKYERRGGGRRRRDTPAGGSGLWAPGKFLAKMQAKICILKANFIGIF
jgi:hypothetical protein